MAYVYSSDALVKPPVLFGRRLLPFTLGHADVLHAAEHPALTDNILTPPDLGSAVFICSKPWEKSTELLRSGKFKAHLIRLGLRASLRPDKTALDRFNEYREFYVAAPPRWESEKTTPSAAPWHLTLFCAIQKNTNLSMEETWNLTIRRAAEICAGLSAIQGDESLMTPEEQNFAEEG